MHLKRRASHRRGLREGERRWPGRGGPSGSGGRGGGQEGGRLRPRQEDGGEAGEDRSLPSGPRGGDAGVRGEDGGDAGGEQLRGSHAGVRKPGRSHARSS